MYGIARTGTSRLKSTILAGSSLFNVETDLDWQVGEQLVFAPTNMRTLDTDICTIKSYDDTTGQGECEENFEGFHYGAEVSTLSDWTVDMRGEVALLNRNIMITASQGDINSLLGEPWGCRILISDFFDTGLTLRTGELEMHNVSVYKCSQKFT